jgi:hypothetical protein
MKLLLSSLLITSVLGQDCPDVVSADCNWDVEITCDFGYDPAGCWLGNYCTQMYTPDVNGENTCYASCPQYCQDGQISCSYGSDEKGCDWGSYCMDAEYTRANGATCPQFCSTFCN